MISNKLSYREIVSRSLFANQITNDAFTSLFMVHKHLNYISSGNIFYLFFLFKACLKRISTSNGVPFLWPCGSNTDQTVTTDDSSHYQVMY